MFYSLFTYLYFCLSWVFVLALRLSSPEAWGMLALPPRMETSSPAVEVGFLTTGPPEKPPVLQLNIMCLGMDLFLSSM